MRHAVAGNVVAGGERLAAALRWADACLADPGGIGKGLRAEVAQVFSPDELEELTYAVVRFANGSKLRMLFGLVPDIEPGTLV